MPNLSQEELATEWEISCFGGGLGLKLNELHNLER